MKRLLALTVILSWFSPSAQALIAFDGSFERHDFSVYRTLQTMGKVVAASDFSNGVDDRIELLSSQGGRTRVAALSLGDADPLTALGKRTEIVGPIEPLQTERWYAWSYFIPETWQPSRTVVSQFHETEDLFDFAAHPPTLSFQAQPTGKVVVSNALDVNAQTTSSSYQLRNLARYELEVGQWTTIAMHVRWSAADNGYLHIYKDGQLLFSESNHPNTFNDAVGPAFKAGLYEDERMAPGTQTILLAGFVAGDAEESLATITSQVPEPEHSAVWFVGLLVAFCSHWARRRKNRLRSVRTIHRRWCSANRWYECLIRALGIDATCSKSDSNRTKPALVVEAV